MSLWLPSPACWGRRLPCRCQRPARSRRAVGCMSSSRLGTPPWAPRSSRPQLSRSRHANFGLGTKGSARAGRGPALQPRAVQCARPREVLGWRAALRPLRRAAPPRLDTPSWKPGRRTPRAEGRRVEAEPRAGGGGDGATETEPAERRRGLEAQPRRRGFRAARGLGARAPASSRLRAHAHRGPGPAGKAPPPRGRGRGAPRRANPLTKERPAFQPAGPAPRRLRRAAFQPAQPKGEQTRRRRPRRPLAHSFWPGPHEASSASRLSPTAVSCLRRS